jgi:hypothetical protein
MNFLEQIAPRFWIGFVSSREAIECRPVRAFRYAKYFGMGPDIATDPLFMSFAVGGHPAPRLCANPICRKRLAVLNKKLLCFNCNDRALFTGTKRTAKCNWPLRATAGQGKDAVNNRKQ